MGTDSGRNSKISDPEIQQLFKGLVSGVIGLVVVVVILLASAVFITLYDGTPKATEEVDTADSSTAHTQVNTLAISGGVVEGIDLVTGLALGEGFEIVKSNCTGCHSSAIILQNRFSREGWKAKIIWMQQTQGLWDLGENEPAILDYLTKYYAPEAPKGRRIPLKDIEWYELTD